MAFIINNKVSNGASSRGLPTAGLRSPRVAIKLRRSASASDLPRCIEQVARAMGALHNPTRELARMNLRADDFSVKSYLGTYLPRTVFEFKTIGTDMLSHPPIRQALPVNRPLRILDLGSGTGGAWMGMVTALHNHGFKQPVLVDAVDGNTLALSKQSAFDKAIGADTGMNIKLTTTHCELGTGVGAFVNDLLALLQRLDTRYDFVLVSKHLSEFYCAAGHAAHGIVYESLRLLEPALTPNGYLVLLDLTTRIDDVSEFFPNLMARELGQFLDEHPQGMRPVLPVPCAVNARGGCAGDRGRCFTQRELHFCHGMGPGEGVRHESTKVVYRVLAPQAHARSITAGYSCDMAYQVNAQKVDQVCHRGQIVSPMRGVNGYLPLVDCTK